MSTTAPNTSPQALPASWDPTYLFFSKGEDRAAINRHLISEAPRSEENAAHTTDSSQPEVKRKPLPPGAVLPTLTGDTKAGQSKAVKRKPLPPGAVVPKRAGDTEASQSKAVKRKPLPPGAVVPKRAGDTGTRESEGHKLKPVASSTADTEILENWIAQNLHLLDEPDPFLTQEEAVVTRPSKRSGRSRQPTKSDQERSRNNEGAEPEPEPEPKTRSPEPAGGPHPDDNADQSLQFDEPVEVTRTPKPKEAKKGSGVKGKAASPSQRHRPAAGPLETAESLALVKTSKKKSEPLAPVEAPQKKPKSLESVNASQEKPESLALVKAPQKNSESLAPAKTKPESLGSVNIPQKKSESLALVKAKPSGTTSEEARWTDPVPNSSSAVPKREKKTTGIPEKSKQVSKTMDPGPPAPKRIGTGGSSLVSSPPSYANAMGGASKGERAPRTAAMGPSTGSAPGMGMGMGGVSGANRMAMGSSTGGGSIGMGTGGSARTAMGSPSGGSSMGMAAGGSARMAMGAPSGGGRTGMSGPSGTRPMGRAVVSEVDDVDLVDEQSWRAAPSSHHTAPAIWTLCLLAGLGFVSLTALCISGSLLVVKMGKTSFKDVASMADQLAHFDIYSQQLKLMAIVMPVGFFFFLIIFGGMCILYKTSKFRQWPLAVFYEKMKKKMRLKSARKNEQRVRDAEKQAEYSRNRENRE